MSAMFVLLSIILLTILNLGTDNGLFVSIPLFILFSGCFYFALGLVPILKKSKELLEDVIKGDEIDPKKIRDRWFEDKMEVRKMSSKKNKLSDKDRFLIYLAMLGGLGFGIAGNFLVTAAFRLSDSLNDRNAQIIFIIAWIFVGAILYMFYKELNRLYAKI